ncbi:Hsp70 family protein [Kineosporia babensis]|uniref:Hsp70 family protein n=1 Tax=Kineosporia babensis TaxID=499548 RepID=A0A9X1SXK6_9ACTN|nr:Hsp70 family protein [Kineosporia babensis]MCD5310318.1 Hsp70 family protein [Kineosporia babensis]
MGIDVGTAFTAAAVGRAGTLQMVRLGTNAPLLASLVGMHPDGSLTVGDPAAEAAGRAQVPAHVFRRRLGDSTPIAVGPRSCTAGELLATLVSTVLERVTAQQGGPPGRVVVTFPAAWGPYRREQLAEVARHAGIPRSEVTLLTEGEAVAAHYLSTRPPAGPAPIAVYDVGGSTFDATVVRTFRRRPTGPPTVGVIGVPESLEWFGGVDLDEAIVRHLDTDTDGALSMLDARRPEDAAVLRRVREACRRAKEELSESTEVRIETELGRPVPLSRAQLEQWIRPNLEAGLPTLRRVIEAAGLQPGDLGTVLLVGGTARVPLVATMVAEDLGRSVIIPPGTQYGAALGAALIASYPRAEPRRRSA